MAGRRRGPPHGARVLSIRGDGAVIQLEAIPSGAVFEIQGAVVQDARGNNIAAPAVFVAAQVPTLRQGEATVTTTGARTQARSSALQGAELLTPVSRVSMSGGVAHVTHDPRRRLTTVGNIRGSVSVTPTNPALRGLRLAPGHGVEITKSSISPPFALVPGGSGAPDLRSVIPSPRSCGPGPAIVTAPSRLSLRSLRGSKCVRVLVTSARPARVLATIFSGKRSVRLFGQRLVVFAGRRPQDHLHPGARAGPHVRRADPPPLRRRLRPRGPGPFRERATRPVVRPITLVP